MSPPRYRRDSITTRSPHRVHIFLCGHKQIYIYIYIVPFVFYSVRGKKKRRGGRLMGILTACAYDVHTLVLPVYGKSHQVYLIVSNLYFLSYVRYTQISKLFSLVSVLHIVWNCHGKNVSFAWFAFFSTTLGLLNFVLDVLVLRTDSPTFEVIRLSCVCVFLLCLGLKKECFFCVCTFARLIVTTVRWWRILHICIHDIVDRHNIHYSVQ